MPDREERHLLSKDLGSGEPNPGLRPELVVQDLLGKGMLYCNKIPRFFGKMLQEVFSDTDKYILAMTNDKFVFEYVTALYLFQACRGSLECQS